MILRVGIRKQNNAGLVTTTFPGPDLCHTIPLGRTFKVRKIMWYNNTGAPQTLIFGTQNNVGAWIPLLPTIYCANTFDGELSEADLPDVEFANDRTPAAGTTGNLLVTASAAGMPIRLEVEEFGA